MSRIPVSSARACSAVRLAFFICLFRPASAADEAVCLAGTSGASCRGQAAGTASRDAAELGSSNAFEVPVDTQVDLISQEVDQLKSIIEISEERIRLLGEFQDALASGHRPHGIPDSYVRAMHEKMPLLSAIPTDKLQAPVASADDYLISKASIPLSEEVNFIKFLPIRSSRSGSSSSSSSAVPMPTALLVAVGSIGTVRLFTAAGDMVLSFSAGHEHPVTHLAVSPSQDEYLVATSDASGTIRTHKISVRQRRLSRNEKQARRNSHDEKVSQHMGSLVNVTAQLYKQMKVPEDSDGQASRISVLALASQSGNKFVIAGDTQGKLSIFTRNGTLRSQINATISPGTPVEGLCSSPGSLLFRAGAEWGYVDLEKMEVKFLDCPKFHGRVTSAVLDVQQPARILAADENGTVWVFSTKSKRDCRVELRYTKSSTRGPIDLASVPGFAVGLERFGIPGQAVSLVALNMSHVKLKSNKAPDTIPPPPEAAVVWRRNRAPVQAWTVHRRTKEGDLLAFLSADGHEIEIVELLMQVYSAPPQDAFANFKMPVIAIAIVLVLGYQYMKQKGRGGGGGGTPGKGSLGSSDFASALRNKRKFSGLKGKRF